MKARFWFLLIALALVVAAPSQASFVNLGFENGSSGWSFYNPPGGSAGNNILGSPANYHPGQTIDPYPPYEGTAYLELRPNGPGNSEVASQTAIFTTAGQIVQAVAAFDSVDYQRNGYVPTPNLFDPGPGPHGDDAAYVEIYSGSWTAAAIASGAAAGSIYDVPWERRVWGTVSGGYLPATDFKTVGDFTSDPWTVWNSKPLGTGTYTLAYRIVSGAAPPLGGGQDPILEKGLKSHSLHDAVPEARSCLLFGLGLLFAVAYRRRSLKGVSLSR